MNRFPKDYESPELLRLDNGVESGWAAWCEGGLSPTTVCTFGNGGPNDGGERLIDPEVIQQSL